MPSSEILVKRFALIKQLYKIGFKQSQAYESLAAFSILAFHDAVEMFLKLLSVHKDIEAPFQFMRYWEMVPELTLKESLKSLNDRRKNIKHHGNLPSKADIEESRTVTKLFFEQNTINQFGIEFASCQCS